MMPANKPLLQTVVDILDKSITTLKKHSNSGKDELDEIEKAIKQVKELVINYKKKHGDIDFIEVIPWDSIKGLD